MNKQLHKLVHNYTQIHKHTLFAFDFTMLVWWLLRPILRAQANRNETSCFPSCAEKLRSTAQEQCVSTESDKPASWNSKTAHNVKTIGPMIQPKSSKDILKTSTAVKIHENWSQMHPVIQNVNQQPAADKLSSKEVKPQDPLRQAQEGIPRQGHHYHWPLAAQKLSKAGLTLVFYTKPTDTEIRYMILVRGLCPPDSSCVSS